MSKSLSILLTILLTLTAVFVLVACTPSTPEPAPIPTPTPIPTPDPVQDTCTIEGINLLCTSHKTSTLAKINPVFSNKDKVETLTYTYDATKIDIDSNGVVTVKARRTDQIDVTATSQSYTVNFKVNVQYINIDDLITQNSLYNYKKQFSSQCSARVALCKTSVTSNTTLVIGDSFTDDYFIGSWLSTYKTADGKTKDIVSAGIGSTTSFHWQAMCATIIGNKTPKNIVLNVGTNDLYGERVSTADLAQSLQTLVMYLHSKCPNSNIYLFSVNQRTDTTYKNEVEIVNQAMQKWCNTWDFVTFVNTCPYLVGDCLVSDGIHPSSKGYDVMFQKLVDCGLQFGYIS